MFKNLGNDKKYIGSTVCLRSKRYSYKQEAKNELQI